MKTIYFIALGSLSLLFACGHSSDPDPKPAPAEYTFTQSLRFPTHGYHRDTAYTTGQIPFVAMYAKNLTSQQDFFGLRIGNETLMDQFELSMPEAKLNPNLTGTYHLLRINPTSNNISGYLTGEYRYRYPRTHQNIFSIADGTISTGSHLTITTYDARNQLISGEFQTTSTGYYIMPPFVPTMYPFELQISGTFKNLPVTR